MDDGRCLDSMAESVLITSGSVEHIQDETSEREALCPNA